MALRNSLSLVWRWVCFNVRGRVDRLLVKHASAGPAIGTRLPETRCRMRVVKGAARGADLNFSNGRLTGT